MLKKYPRIDSLIHKAVTAEVGAWLLTAGSFIMMVWLVRVVCSWLNIPI